MTKLQAARRAAYSFAWLLSAALLVAGTPSGASAQSPDPRGVIPDGFKQTDLPEHLLEKRFQTTGAGMPSIRGPYEDTVNMDWLGQITNAEMKLQKIAQFSASFMSDIWGWTDTAPTTGNVFEEYALVGTSSGVVFVRITDPTNPEFLGLVPSTNLQTIRNFWWDIKTYGNYAFWTTEVNGAGVAIFDLKQLDGLSAVEPGTDAAVLPIDTFTGRWGRNDGSGYLRAHNIAINPAKPYAYLIGVNKEEGAVPPLEDEGIVILDISNPSTPQEVGRIDSNSGGGPVDSHDAQIVTYKGSDEDLDGFSRFGREILFNFNGDERNIQIWDVTDPTDPQFISEFSYDGATFSHQGWLTEDHRFLLAGDEADEEVGLQQPNNALLPDTARTHLCNIQDLDAPVCFGVFDSPAASIDHNLFIRTDQASGREFVYQANYTSGIRVTELTRGPGSGPTQTATLAEVAHMDTEPLLPDLISWNANRFLGPWGVYPFFPNSDTIIASDGLNGLILMRLSDSVFPPP
jgi:choice-of-anchor B domain-containing protein